MSSFQVVSGPRLVGSDTVESTLDFVQRGTHFREVHRVTLIVSGGRLLINSDSSSGA
jgi:hypothetical protein